MPSKFKDGTDIEEYRKQAVELMDFLGMPINKVELGIQKDDSKILSDQWDLVIANGLDPDATWEYLLRWFALSARLKAHTCFDFVLDCMAQQDYLNLFKNDKAILLSLVLFSCYTEGLALMFSHEALSNVLDINETFENKNFFFTEYQSTRPNTILGVIAYGRLKPGLIDMLDVALELGAKMYVENSNSPVHLAISSGNYQALKILARYSLTEIICELAFVNLDTVPFEIQNWIMAIWNGGRKEVEQLRDFLPNRPVARETANRFFPTAMSWATLEELHKHPTLYPGDIIECKISNLEKQQIVFLGKERIDGKTVKKCDSDLNTRGCVFTGSTCDDEYKNFRIGRNTSKKATIDVIFEALETAAY